MARHRQRCTPVNRWFVGRWPVSSSSLSPFHNFLAVENGKIPDASAMSLSIRFIHFRGQLWLFDNPFVHDVQIWFYERLDCMEPCCIVYCKGALYALYLYGWYISTGKAYYLWKCWHIRIFSTVCGEDQNFKWNVRTIRNRELWQENTSVTLAWSLSQAGIWLMW